MTTRLSSTGNLPAGRCKGLILAAGLLALPLAAPVIVPVAAQAGEVEVPAAGSPERAAMETVIREYLMDNPEVLIEALHAYEAKRQAAEAERQKTALLENRDRLAGDSAGPFIGNPEGDVVIVEFFDYRCGYCRASAPRLQAALQADPQLKVVMKEFPILSEESVSGAKAALAAHKQDKYGDFHFALMKNPGDLSMAHLKQVATQVGMDPEQMEQDMADEAVTQAIAETHQLARDLGISGTPAFVIGDELIPGAIDLDTMLARIQAARAAKS
ncbi:MAG TPA: DsbA family protein [Kiloniellaceae bacterium]|nr:DsbA family protein [Kiloniellaceae bacterium]